MIYGEIKELNRYLGIHKNLDTAINAILNGALDTRKKGRNIVSGDEVFFSYPGDMVSKKKEEAKLEGHKVYTDIHILFDGAENIGYVPRSEVTEASYNEKFDFIEYTGEVDTIVTLKPGMFVLFFPEEPHKPLIVVDEPKLVDKIIFKIKM